MCLQVPVPLIGMTHVCSSTTFHSVSEAPWDSFQQSPLGEYNFFPTSEEIPSFLVSRLLVVVVPWKWDHVLSDTEFSAFLNQHSVSGAPSPGWGACICLAKLGLNLTPDASLRCSLRRTFVSLCSLASIFTPFLSIRHISICLDSYWRPGSSSSPWCSCVAYESEDVAGDLCFSFYKQIRRLCLTSVSSDPNKSCYTTFLHLVRLIYLFRVQEGERSLFSLLV